MECWKKRDRERRVGVNLIKGLTPIQHNILRVKYILLKGFLEVLCLCLGIDIDTTGLFTNLLFVSVSNILELSQGHKVSRIDSTFILFQIDAIFSNSFGSHNPPHKLRC